MILTKNYKAIINDEFDFSESIIEDINFINCSDLEIKVFYFFDPYKDRTLKIIFLQAGYLVVFMHGVALLLGQLVVGAVADAQHTQTVVLQLLAEAPVGQREVGRDENKVFHAFVSSLVVFLLRG